jgi:nicotinate-nucleotide pyrophosphorylase (carboxylating)
MNKSSLILKYFQKADLLTTRKLEYCRSITSLFKWMVENDKVGVDSTTHLFNIQSRHRARIIAKENAILAGVEEISYLLAKLTKLSFTPLIKDGQRIKNGQTVAKVEGVGSEILGFERTVLNILQRMSGIATETNHLILIMAGGSSEGLPNEASLGIAEESLSSDKPALEAKFWVHPEWVHHEGKRERQDLPFLTATRKTPWMALDKKAVAVGGGLTHRLALADAVLVKDNHLALLRKKFELKDDVSAVKKALQLILSSTQNQLIEVEVETENEAFETVNTFKKINKNNYLAVMFDNFSPASFSLVFSKLSNVYDLSSVIFEASGGITKENIRQWRKTGADLLSIGALTHSPRAVNLSLEF